MSYSSHQTDLDTASFIKNPKAGDIYYLSFVEGHYTTIKINQISKDSLNVFVNDMEIDSKAYIDNIDIDKNYTKKSTISKNDMLKLYDEKKIYEVKRN